MVSSERQTAETMSMVRTQAVDWRVREALSAARIRRAQRRRRGVERETRFQVASWTEALERHHRSEAFGR